MKGGAFFREDFVEFLVEFFEECFFTEFAEKELDARLFTILSLAVAKENSNDGITSGEELFFRNEIAPEMSDLRGGAEPAADAAHRTPRDRLGQCNGAGAVSRGISPAITPPELSRLRRRTGLFLNKFRIDYATRFA